VRRLILLLAVAVTAGGSTSTALGQDSGPGIAIGSVTQGWNKVRVDYGVGDPARTELRVVLPGGRSFVVDRGTALQGTLVWNRRLSFRRVNPGSYRLEVVATNASGTSVAAIRLKLNLAYLFGGARLVGGKAVLHYALAGPARVRLFVRRAGAKRYHLAVQRIAWSGHNKLSWDFTVGGQRVKGGRYFLLLRAVRLKAN
jgi:hypothetical protein